MYIFGEDKENSSHYEFKVLNENRVICSWFQYVEKKSDKKKIIHIEL
jgi:hypothetical protein